MRKLMTYMVVIMISLTLSLTPVAAMDKEDTGVYVYESGPSAEAMIGDALIVRPVSLVCLGATSLFFLIGWPFAAAGGNQDVAKQKLLKDPVEYTFKRPLGDF